MFGSVPLRTYLPDGDIDLSVFCAQDVAQSMRDTWAIKLQSVIEQELAAGSAPFKIGDVTVINAEVGGNHTGRHPWQPLGHSNQAVSTAWLIQVIRKSRTVRSAVQTALGSFDSISM